MKILKAKNKIDGCETLVAEVDKLKLMEIGKKISSIPTNFNVHKTLKKIFDLRKKVIEDGKLIDWSTAESLAFGTLLT